VLCILLQCWHVALTPGRRAVVDSVAARAVAHPVALFVRARPGFLGYPQSAPWPGGRRMRQAKPAELGRTSRAWMLRVQTLSQSNLSQDQRGSPRESRESAGQARLTQVLPAQAGPCSSVGSRRLPNPFSLRSHELATVFRARPRGGPTGPGARRRSNSRGAWQRRRKKEPHEASPSLRETLSQGGSAATLQLHTGRACAHGTSLKSQRSPGKVCSQQSQVRS